MHERHSRRHCIPLALQVSFRRLVLLLVAVVGRTCVARPASASHGVVREINQQKCYANKSVGSFVNASNDNLTGGVVFLAFSIPVVCAVWSPFEVGRR